MKARERSSDARATSLDSLFEARADSGTWTATPACEELEHRIRLAATRNSLTSPPRKGVGQLFEIFESFVEIRFRVGGDSARGAR
jgi:hypothetical protein